MGITIRLVICNSERLKKIQQRTNVIFNKIMDNNFKND